MIDYDDVCQESAAKREIHSVQGEYGESCSQACSRQGYVCDPGLFTVLHTGM